MKTRLITRGMLLLLLGGVLAGCATASRGSFGPTSCPSGDRIAVDPSAAYAVYVDKDGNQLGTTLEDLKGTNGNLMCPTPPGSDDPGACGTGYCAKVIGRTTYCVRC